MTDEEKKTSYKKLQESNESLKKSNDDLTSKVNSLLDALEKEKAQKQRIELVAKCNSLNKEFKPTDEMSEEFLNGVFYAWSNPPAKTPPKPNLNGGVTPPPVVTKEEIKLNGKPIPDDLKQFMAIRTDLEEHNANAMDGVM